SKADVLKQILPIQEQTDEIPIIKDILPDLEEDEYLDDPMEIDFVQKEEPKTSVITIECKIKCLKIPAMTLDSEAEPPIITENIVE
ncbi:4201_t:CDS:1, partial [Funneliformis geosporum]